MSLKYDGLAQQTIEQLKDIFAHYSKQNLIVKSHTFEDIKEDQGLLNLNKVIAFLKDFDISVSPMVSVEPKISSLV
jgi:hypothetical protein